PEHGGDHGHADRGWHRELHGARDRGGAERDQGPQHHGDRGVLHHLALQSGPGDRGRGGPGGGGAGREVPGRRRRDHHRHPLLQERGQHGDPPRQPVDDRRGEARDGDLHGRDGGGLAADDLRDPGGDPGQHGLRGVLLRAQRALQREPGLLHDAGRGHPAAARLGERGVGRQRRLRVRRGEQLPDQHVPGAELLGGRPVHPGAVVHHHVEHDHLVHYVVHLVHHDVDDDLDHVVHHVEHDHLVHHDVDDELHYLIHDDIDYDDIVDNVHHLDHVEHHDLDDELHYLIHDDIDYDDIVDNVHHFDHVEHHDLDDELHYLIHDDIDYDDIVDNVHHFDHVEHHDLDAAEHQAADDHHHHLDHDDTVRVGERSCM